MPIETWERTRQVNLDGSFYIVQGNSSAQMASNFLICLRSRCKSNEGPITSRRCYYRSFIDLRTCWRWNAMVRPLFMSRPLGMQFTLTDSHYTPTKAALLSLMQSCAVALGKYNIRCNAVLPGTIATDINKDDLSDETKREYTVKRTVLGRLGGKPSQYTILLFKQVILMGSSGGCGGSHRVSCERPGAVRHRRLPPGRRWTLRQPSVITRFAICKNSFMFPRH